MAKTNNTLHLPVILSQEENNKQVLKAGLQPAYGPHASLDAAKTALEAEFNTISNIPRGYTFCIINSAKKPEEWWFTRKGEWSSIAKKQSGSVDLSDLQFKIDEDNNFYYSVDGGESWSDPMPLGSISAEDFVNLLQSNLKFKVINGGELKVAYDGENFSTLFKLRINNNGVLEAAGPNSGYEPISGGKFSDLLAKFLSIKVDENGDVKVSSDNETEWETVGTVKLKITDGNKIWIATNYTSGGSLNWREVGVISVDGGEGGGSTSVRLLGVITPDNVGTIPFKNHHERVAYTWSALPACNLIVYMGVDYKESFCAYMNGKYPSAQPGDYVLIQSTLQNNTEPKANANDYTTTFEPPASQYGTSDIVNRVADTSERGYEDCYYIAFKTHEDSKWGLGYYGKKTTKVLADIEVENTVGSGMVYHEEGVLKGILINANSQFTVSEIPDIVSLYLNGNTISRGDTIPAGLHLFIAKENATYIAANPSTSNNYGFIEFVGSNGTIIREAVRVSSVEENWPTRVRESDGKTVHDGGGLSIWIYPAEARATAKIFRENTLLNAVGNSVGGATMHRNETIEIRGTADGYSDATVSFTYDNTAVQRAVDINFSEVSQGS